jgi:hypothetical protein
MTNEITSSLKPNVNRFQSKKKAGCEFEELAAHLASDSPFYSMLQGFTKHTLTDVRPAGTDYFVYLTGRRITILYSADILKKHIYGGLALDEML